MQTTKWIDDISGTKKYVVIGSSAVGAEIISSYGVTIVKARQQLLTAAKGQLEIASSYNGVTSHDL